jgi:two-component system phosphate regulon response regulator PhoB
VIEARSSEEPLKLLVVEDEPDIGSLLDYVLGREGFSVQLARTGQEALVDLDRRRPDLVVLDLMLPDLNGLEILRRIRRDFTSDETYVIILSARKDEDDRVKGFELGADDYMIKPFSPRELVLRVRKALERTDSVAATKVSLSAGPIEIDLDRHEVRVDGEPVHLTLTEFRLLADLVRNQGRVRTRGMLMTEVWGYDSQAMSRTVDTHIRRLRSKLGSGSEWLDTVRGMGYRIRKPGNTASTGASTP